MPTYNRPTEADQEAPSKVSRGLFALAILLLALGGIALCFDAIRPLGGIAIVVSVVLIRKSKKQGPTASTERIVQRPDLGSAYHPGLLAWSLGAVSLLSIGISLWFLHVDAIHGHNQIWPVYLFFAVAILCGSYLACLVGSLFLTK